jgi:GrpB-like predicted nucleotidyltransferase (UPF0157 family)
MTSASAVELRRVAEFAALANEIVARFSRDAAPLLGEAEVHHIGATSFGEGRTKGDVDVNVRVQPEQFDELVAALRGRYDVAQPDNWTHTFASFGMDDYALPLGIQVTVIGSDDDYLVYLRDRLLADPQLRERYDEVKAAAAAGGADAYWRAKDAFLRGLLAERPPLT